MKWNFPIEKTVACLKCGRDFAIVLRSRDSQEHSCPSCGTTHAIRAGDFETMEKKAIEVAREGLRRALRR